MEIYSIDIGGSSIKHGLINVDEKHFDITENMPVIYLKTRSFSEIREQVIFLVQAHANRIGKRINVAISTTGGVSRSGLVWSAGHFKDYINIDWQLILQTELPTLIGKVFTVNDGKASTWAEYQSVGIGTEVFVHFVVGTGVGGGIVCFERLLYGDEETAGGLGHMKVGGESELVCSCGRKGCVEPLASSQAISRYFGKLVQTKNNQNKTQPTFEETFNAARSGVHEALKAFEIAGEWLGVAMSNIINILNPKYITVGGGVILASDKLSSDKGGPYLASAIRRSHELAFKDIGKETIIRPASTGNNGGILGAALLCSSAIINKS